MTNKGVDYKYKTVIWFEGDGKREIFYGNDFTALKQRTREKMRELYKIDFNGPRYTISCDHGLLESGTLNPVTNRIKKDALV
jgi:hypothetical protein